MKFIGDYTPQQVQALCDAIRTEHRVQQEAIAASDDRQRLQREMGWPSVVCQCGDVVLFVSRDDLTEVHIVDPSIRASHDAEAERLGF